MCDVFASAEAGGGEVKIGFEGDWGGGGGETPPAFILHNKNFIEQNLIFQVKKCSLI